MAFSTKAREHNDTIRANCPTQIVPSPAQQAEMLRQAMSAWLVAGGGGDQWIWNMSDPDVFKKVDTESKSTAPGAGLFAYRMYNRRFLAYRPDCTFDQQAWKCLLEWYARRTNQDWWFSAQPMMAVDPLMPDYAFQGCVDAPATATTQDLPGRTPANEWPDSSTAKSPPAQGSTQPIDWGNLLNRGTIIPTPAGGITFQPGRIPWQGLPDMGGGLPNEGAGAEEPAATATSSGLKWVGILAAVGLAGVGIWYVTRPAPKSNPAARGGHTGYSLQTTWDRYLRALRSGNTDSALLWYGEFLDKGGWKHAADTAMMTGGRSAPSKAPV